MFDVFHHRARAVAEAAEVAGVQLADGDPLDAARAPFELFRRGQLQEVERTLWRSACMAVSGLVVRRVCDRVGYRPVITAALGLVVAAGLLASFSTAVRAPPSPRSP